MAIIGIMAGLVFLAGLIGTITIHLLLFLRLRRTFPDIYQHFTIIWKDYKYIESRLNTLEHASLLKLYQLSKQVPIVSVVFFGILIFAFIVISKL